MAGGVASRYPGLVVAAAVLAFGSSAFAADSGGPLPLAAVAAAVHTEATPKTPAESKLDSSLLIAIRPPNVMAASGKQLRADPPKDNAGRVELDIKAIVSPDLSKAIEALGGTIVFAPTDPRDDSMRVRLPLGKVAALAARADVFSVRTAVKALTNAVTPEGDIAHAARAARGQFGATGTGIKVGVISDSVDDPKGALNLALGSQDVPLSLDILPFQAGSGSGEGLAMLEIVHSLAPDAQLAFATANNGPGAMAQNIKNLAAAGCRIIVDDITFPNEPPFQDGVVARAVNTVSSQGVLYLSSAANAGNTASHWSSTFEGDFQADGTAPATWPSIVGPISLPHPGVVMGFSAPGGQLVDRIELDPDPKNPQSIVSLFWDNPLADPTNTQQAAADQYDVYVFDVRDQLVGISASTMGVGTDPVQVADLTLTVGLQHPVFQPGDYIKIVKASAAQTRFIHIEASRVPFKDQSIATAGNTHGHNASGAANALTVAAVGATPGPNYAAFSTMVPPPTVEYFSSDGPRRMVFDEDGNRYPSGSLILNKPDIAGADGVTTTVPEHWPFFGTSAAAPHVAAIAALIMSQRPSLTAGQVRQILIDSAMKIGTAAWDPDSGYGIALADRALASLPPEIVAQYHDATLTLAAGGSVAGWSLPRSRRYTAIASGVSRVAVAADGSVTSSMSGLTAVRNAGSNVVGLSSDAAFLIRKDGSVECWPPPSVYLRSNFEPPDPSNVTNAAAIVGQPYSPYYVLKRDGTVEKRNLDTFTKATAVPGIDRVIDIKGLFLPLGAVMLRQDGTVATVRGTVVTDDIAYHRCSNGPCPDDWPYVPRPPSLSGVAQIAAGWAHVLALRQDGTVVAWGANQHHQTEVPQTLTDVVAISASGYMSYALTRSGQIVSWGGSD